MAKALSVIILTYIEEKNLVACLESIRSLDAKICVLDSGSTDATVSIARDAGCEVIEHPFENCAANWAFDNIPTKK